MATTLHRKPMAVDGCWLLVDHNDKTAQEWMLVAITALAALGWRGTLLSPVDGGDGIGRVQFSNDASPTYSPQASIGEWVVLDEGQLKVLTVEDCISTYDEVEV